MCVLSLEDEWVCIKLGKNSVWMGGRKGVDDGWWWTSLLWTHSERARRFFFHQSIATHAAPCRAALCRTFLTVEAQSRISTLPTAVEPVKDTFRTYVCEEGKVKFVWVCI